MTMPLRSDPAEALAAAVKADDVPQVRRVLERYPELRGKLDDPMPDGPFGATPLLGAVSRGNREMIDVLLHAGADINARSHWWAGSFGVLDHDGDLAPFLIERSAILTAHAAARLGMLDELDRLVSAHPDLVHARGGDGQTPLHFAPTVEIAEYLLEHGADIDARDIDHESTPAQWMVRDRQEVARYLVTRGCRTDILMAAALGDLELVRKHLDADPACIRMSVSEVYFPKQDPRSGGTIYNWTLDRDKTAHALARWFGHEDIFKLLMKRSPDELKLVVACELGEDAIVQDLLARRPNLVETLSDTDRRKLAHAARDDDFAAVKRMLAAGWPVDVRGQHGGTPLHWAAWRGDSDMIRELLRHGAPVDVRDHDYDGTPLHWAIYASVHGWHPDRGDYAGTVEELIRAGATLPPLTDDVEASEPVRAVLRRQARGNS
jgi:ankyrin repeat protein